jgi:hypothetical protein
MKNLRLYVFILFCLSVTPLLAQQKYTISGTVKDKRNGETMIGVTVFPVELKGIGASCNEYGFYSLTLPEGSYHIVCSSIGFRSDTLLVDLNSNVKIDRFMVDNSTMIKEITVTATKKDDNITKTEIGRENRY